MSAVRWIGLVAWLVGALLTVASASAQSTNTVVVGQISGIINPVMAGYVSRVIDEAEASQAEAVVFTMDTPGGLSDSMRDINQRILSARVPILVYVWPDGARAGSAGVYITYAAHLAAMAPTTNIGSATPVALGENGGEAQMSDEMRNKVTNDAVAQIRALAEQRGRNAEFAEKAVREATNLQASEALKQNVVNYVAPDLSDLLRQVEGTTVKLPDRQVTLHTANAEIQHDEMSGIEQFLLTITNPTIAYILLSLGSLGLVLELYNPGAVFPGVIGGIALLLAFYALGTLPVNFAGLALMGFGLILFMLEPFVVSHGILAVGGAIAFAAGSLVLFNAPATAPFLRVSLVAIGAVTLVMLAFAVLILGSVLRLRRRHVVTGREGMLGAVGEVRTPLSVDTPGMVHVQSELWRAVSEGGPIEPGEQVVVHRMDGLLLTVRRLAPLRELEPAAPAAAVPRAARRPKRA